MPFDGTGFEMPVPVAPKRQDAVLRALIEARALLDAGWTKGSAFRDENGDSVLIRPRSATRHCILGALSKATGSDFVYSPLPLTREVYRFNDGARDKTDVLSLFDRAIENHTVARFHWMPMSSARKWERALTEIRAAMPA